MSSAVLSLSFSLFFRKYMILLNSIRSTTETLIDKTRDKTREQDSSKTPGETRVLKYGIPPRRSNMQRREQASRDRHNPAG